MRMEHDAWASFYAELDPEKRKTIFNSLADPENELDNFRRMLCMQRYCDLKHPDRKVDTWLWRCGYLPGLYQSRWAVGNPMRWEMRETLRELHLESPERLSEPEREALYLEFRNAARRYIASCEKRSSSVRTKRRICRDIWEMSRGVAHAAGAEAQMKLWCDALYDELVDRDTLYREIYERIDQKHLI